MAKKKCRQDKNRELAVYRSVSLNTLSCQNCGYFPNRYWREREWKDPKSGFVWIHWTGKTFSLVRSCCCSSSVERKARSSSTSSSSFWPLLRNLIFLVFSSVFPSCYPPLWASVCGTPKLVSNELKSKLFTHTVDVLEKRLSWLGREEFKVHWSDSRRQSIIISSDESDHELNSCVKVCNAHRGVNRISLAVIHGQWPLLPSHCGAAGHLTYMYSIYTIIITIAVTFHIHTHTERSSGWWPLRSFIYFYFRFLYFISTNHG